MTEEQKKLLDEEQTRQLKEISLLEPGSSSHNVATESLKTIIEANNKVAESEATVQVKLAEAKAKEAEAKREKLEPWLNFGTTALTIAAGTAGTIFSAAFWTEAVKTAVKYSETGVFEMIPKQVVNAAVTAIPKLMKGSR